MIVPDTNVLVHAYNSASPSHEQAKQWWEACLSGTEPVGFVHPVLFGFVRVVTMTRASLLPMTVAEATERVAEWLARKAARRLYEDSEHFSRVTGLLLAAGSSGGNLVTDAQIASIAIAHGGTVHTADRDFQRFRGLKTFYPLD